MTGQLLINGLIAGSLAALIAGGLSLVFGVLGVYNMALGQTVLMGGYSTWWAHQVIGLPLWASILVGLLTGVIVSIITFDIFVRPFYRRHIRLPLVTTIALGMILDGFILLAFGEPPRRILSATGAFFEFADARMGLHQVILIMVTVCILLLFGWVLHRTAFGRRLRAVVQNDSAALSLGIPALSLHRFIVICSGLLAASGGIFLGIDQNLSPTLAFPLTIKAYAAVVAGGMGNVWGTIFFAYLIAFAEQIVVGFNWFGVTIPAGYQSTVPLLFIIVFLLIRPHGLNSQSRFS